MKNSHTPHEAAGRGWSMGILHTVVVVIVVVEVVVLSSSSGRSSDRCSSGRYSSTK